MKVAIESEGRESEIRVGVCALPANEEQAAWIELIPAGRFSGRDGRGPYRLADAKAVIASTQALQMDAGLPIDYDHATDLGAPEGRPAPAAGWIKELAERAKALWGRVEWTQHGAAALATREYRYVSPVFEHDVEGVVVRLLRAALTNNPNLYLKAIAAQVGNSACADSESAAGSEDTSQADIRLNGLLGGLREILALGTEATPETILETAQRLVEARDGGGAVAKAETNPENIDRGRYVALEHYQKAVRELSALQTERTREEGERAVQGAMRAGKIVPAQREWALEYYNADPSGFAQFIARQPALALGALELEGDPRRHRARRAACEASSAAGLEELSPIETAICARLGLRATDYARRKTERAAPNDRLL